MWNVNTGEVRQTGILGGHYTVAFAQSAWKAASIEEDGSVQVWDLSTLKPLDRFPSTMTHRGLRGVLTTIAISDDGNRVATHGADGHVHVRDRRDPDLKPLGHTLHGWISLSTAVSFSPDGELLAIGHRDGIVSLWDSTTLKLLRSERLLTSGVLSLSFLSGGRAIAAGDMRGAIATWDFRSEVAAPRLLGTHTSACGALLVSHDGRRLFSGDQLGNLSVWDVETRQRVYSFKTLSRVTRIALSPDGRMLVGATYGEPPDPPTVKVWRAPGMPLAASLAALSVGRGQHEEPPNVR